jgi:uncharacterized protein
MVKRTQPDQQILVQIGVPSVDEYSAKVETLGGKIIVPKKAIPGMGYFAICIDTENNVFGIVETDPWQTPRVWGKIIASLVAIV